VSDVPESDGELNLPHPRSVYDLLGHSGAEAQITDAFNSGRMHHALMITGPKGSGKSTLAYRLIRRALGAKSAGEGLSVSPDDQVCRQIEAQSHPDFMVLRRTYNDKTKKLRGEISVEEARKITGFFAHSASGEHWRVCLVDAADDLNTNSANALLKTLEEPPRKGLLILIVHSPGRLLPTIRSRCRKLILRTPGVKETAQWLEQRHQIDPYKALQSSQLSNGAPGYALSLVESDMVSLKPKLDGLLSTLPRLDPGTTSQLASQAGRKDGQVFLDVLMEFLVDQAENRARETIASTGLANADRWVSASKDLRGLARDQKAIYLDPKQTVHAAFKIMQDAAISA
jgi:DNA polymerase-3 subunit delta'